MKVSITFKTPNAVGDALDRELETEGLDEFEAQELMDQYEAEFKKWIEYGEYVTIEFDLDKGTATVQENT